LFSVEDGIFTGYIVEYLALPASFGELVYRPWTIITYMFLHIDIFHILFNMLWLYWFGKIFLGYLKPRQLLSTYLLGGIAGGLLYMIAYNTFPVFSDTLFLSKALGASASVMAIVTAISFYVPNYTIHLLFLGRIKILYLAIALFVIDFFMIRSSNSGGHIAHIGGALWGFAFAYYYRRGKDIGKMFHIDLKKFVKPFMKEKKKPFKNVYSNERPMTDEEYNKARAQQEKKIDEILDKISKSGYESLTTEEKDMLFNSSNKKSQR
jgi:membrane associated rhomboid family serine protease